MELKEEDMRIKREHLRVPVHDYSMIFKYEICEEPNPKAPVISVVYMH